MLNSLYNVIYSLVTIQLYFSSKNKKVNAMDYISLYYNDEIIIRDFTVITVGDDKAIVLNDKYRDFADFRAKMCPSKIEHGDEIIVPLNVILKFNRLSDFKNDFQIDLISKTFFGPLI